MNVCNTVKEVRCIFDVDGGVIRMKYKLLIYQKRNQSK